MHVLCTDVQEGERGPQSTQENECLERLRAWRKSSDELLTTNTIVYSQEHIMTGTCSMALHELTCMYCVQMVRMENEVHNQHKKMSAWKGQEHGEKVPMKYLPQIPSFTLEENIMTGTCPAFRQ